MEMMMEMMTYVGRMIALSILHGGPGPVFFAPIIADYLFSGICAVKPSINDVPERQLQLKIQKVWCADTEALGSIGRFLIARF